MRSLPERPSKYGEPDYWVPLFSQIVGLSCRDCNGETAILALGDGLGRNFNLVYFKNSTKQLK